MPELTDFESDSEILTEKKEKLEKPKLFKVILHNDDFTTMDFVVFVLEYVFKKSTGEAFLIMLNVHQKGIGVAGVYTYEIANVGPPFWFQGSTVQANQIAGSVSATFSFIQ